jgi:hypothetical protein
VRELPVQVPGEPPLAGTLTLPDAPAPVPAVLLATGSGPLDRDSNHRRLRFDVTRALAHALAEGGLASLRYDKRGVGGSPGDWRAAGLYDNVDDLARVLGALATRPEVDPAGSCWPGTARAPSSPPPWPGGRGVHRRLRWPASSCSR